MKIFLIYLVFLNFVLKCCLNYCGYNKNLGRGGGGKFMYLVLYFYFCINFIYIDEKILVNFKLR